LAERDALRRFLAVETAAVYLRGPSGARSCWAEVFGAK